ncbi:hypothetical protein H0H93_009178 [Arthromyces matolae]|nr:hypothetical protein H0H93_009178 [Arthromyces matolae]
MGPYPFCISPEEAIVQLAPYASLACLFKQVIGSLGARFLPGFNFQPIRPLQITPVYFPAWLIDSEISLDFKYSGQQNRATGGTVASPAPDPVPFTQELEKQHGVEIPCLPYTISPFAAFDFIRSETGDIQLEDDISVVPSSLDVTMFAAYPVLFPLYLARYQYPFLGEERTITFFLEAHRDNGNIHCKGSEISQDFRSLPRPFSDYGNLLEDMVSPRGNPPLLFDFHGFHLPQRRHTATLVNRWLQSTFADDSTAPTLARKSGAIKSDADLRIRPYNTEEREATEKWLLLGQEIDMLTRIHSALHNPEAADFSVHGSGHEKTIKSIEQKIAELQADQKAPSVLADLVEGHSGFSDLSSDWSDLTPPVTSRVEEELSEQESARQLLRSLAAQVRPIMKSHGFAVNSFEEVAPALINKDFKLIHVTDETGTREKLSHMNHGPDFQALWRRLRAEVRSLQDKGYYGYWSSATRLADSAKVSGQGIEPGDLPEYLCGGAQTRSRPASIRTRRPRKPRNTTVTPSNSTGRQTAKRRKAGARVTSKTAFVGHGSTLMEGTSDTKGKGTGFGKQANSKRAREERALAIEQRMVALQAQTKASSSSGQTESESDDDGLEDVVLETDQDRRETLLASDRKEDLEQLKSGCLWGSFEDDFDFNGTQKTTVPPADMCDPTGKRQINLKAEGKRKHEGLENDGVGSFDRDSNRSEPD